MLRNIRVKTNFIYLFCSRHDKQTFIWHSADKVPLSWRFPNTLSWLRLHFSLTLPQYFDLSAIICIPTKNWFKYNAMSIKWLHFTTNSNSCMRCSYIFEETTFIIVLLYEYLVFKKPTSFVWFREYRVRLWLSYCYK